MKLTRPNVDTLIRGAAHVGVSMVAGIAFVISYTHAYEVAIQYGESGMVARLVPLVIDGLLIVASVVQLDAARRGRKAGWLSWLALVVGILLTLGANVLHGIANGIVGAIIASLPAVTLTISFELLMHLMRRSAVESSKAEALIDEPLQDETTPAEVVAVTVEELETAKPRRRSSSGGTVRVSAARVELVKSYLASLDPSAIADITGESLAKILPKVSDRYRRAALAKAKAEMGLGDAEKLAEDTADTLPGMTPAMA